MSTSPYQLSNKGVLWILSLFVILWLAFIQIDRTIFVNKVNKLSSALEHLNSLVGLRFSNSTNTYLESGNWLKEPDALELSDHHLENFMEIRFFSDCSFWQVPNGNITQASRLSRARYQQLSFYNKVLLAEYCDSILELEHHANQSDLQAYHLQIVALIANPSALLADGGATESKEVSPWFVQARNDLSLTPIDIPAHFLTAKQASDGVFAQPIVVNRTNAFSQSENIFGIPYGDFYHFSDIVEFNNELELSQLLTRLADEATINNSYLAKLSPIIFVLAVVLYYLGTLLAHNLRGLYHFNSLFRLNSFAFVNIHTESRSVRVIASNLKTKALVFADESATVMLDKELKPTRSFVKARYVNMQTTNETMQFSIVSSSFNSDSQDTGMMLLINNPEIQQTLAEYQSIYRIDALTNLPNRTMIEEVVHRKKPCKGYLMAVMDLDHFKQINDTYGHLFGDLVLKQFADFLRESFGLNSQDHIIRLGGEEFMLLLELEPESYNANVEAFAKRILTFNQAAFSVSAGITFWQKGEVNFDVAYKVADDLLYKAKRAGRKRITFQQAFDDQQQLSEVSSDVAPMPELNLRRVE